jgi:hypothetical protein
MDNSAHLQVLLTQLKTIPLAGKHKNNVNKKDMMFQGKTKTRQPHASNHDDGDYYREPDANDYEYYDREAGAREVPMTHEQRAALDREVASWGDSPPPMTREERNAMERAMAFERAFQQRKMDEHRARALQEYEDDQNHQADHFSTRSKHARAA